MTEPQKPKTAGGKELAERAATREKKRKKVWCCFHPEEPQGTGGMVLFGNELAALRHAAEHHQGCKAIEFGEDVLKQLNA